MTANNHDVWVRTRTRHTPAHRIRVGEVPSARASAGFLISCPPGVLFGGEILSRTDAAALEALPCTRCFPPKGTAPLPPVTRVSPHVLPDDVDDADVIGREVEPEAGQPFRLPDGSIRDGYVAGECGHAVAGSEWAAGFRECERCGTDLR